MTPVQSDTLTKGNPSKLRRLRHCHEGGTPIQHIEVYKGKLILYSLANFVHDLEGFREQSLMAILVRCLIADGKIHRLSFVPGVLRGHGPPDFARLSQAGGRHPSTPGLRLGKRMWPWSCEKLVACLGVAA